MATRHSTRPIVFGALLVAFVSIAGLLLRAEPPQAVGTWASLGASPDSRIGAAVVTLSDGRTLIAGGVVESAATDSVAIFDPADGSFASAGTLLAPRVGHTATLLQDGRVLIAGGTVGNLVSADLELFDPSSGTSTLAATMAQARSGHAAALLPDGTVLIAGGTGTDGVLQTAEIFDPETGSTSTTTFPMLTPRTGASATTLIDGRVLIAGGSSNGSTDLKTAELYQPSSQFFEATDTLLSTPRSGHAAVLLPHNNAVLLAGGSSDGLTLQSVELFLPAEFPDPYSYGMGRFGPTGSMNSARSGAVAAPHIEGYAFAMGGGASEAEVYRFATIKTDKDDYAPGELARITGSGWEPDSQVTLLFQEDPAVHDDYLLQVPTDGDGNIYFYDWAPEQHDLNVRFYLMAKQTTPQGQRIAQTTFTDANRSISINSFSIISPAGATDNTLNNGQSFTVRVQFTPNGSGNWTNVTAALTVPSGWTKSADFSGATAAAGTQVTHDWTVTATSIVTNNSLSLSVTGTAPPGDTCNSCPFSDSITVTSVNPASLTTTSMTAAKTVGGGTLVKAGDSITVTMVVANGAAPRATANTVAASALAVNPTLTATGACSPSVTAAANIAAGGSRTYTYTCTATGGNGTLTFTGSGNGTDANSGAAAGSGDSTTNAITVDSSAPATPSVPDMTAGSDSGSNSDDETNDNTPTFTGTAEAGTTVKIFSDGVQVGSGTAAAYTTGITVSTLSDGAHAITATATDTAGNESAPSSALSVRIDTVKPTVTINKAAGQADPTNTQPINFTVVFNEAINATTFTNADVTLTGTAGNVASATKVITFVSGNTYNVAVSGLTTDGTVTATISAGGVEDVAANTNTASTSSDNTVLLDAAPPAQPATPDLNGGDDTGVSTIDNQTNQTTNLTFMGGGGSVEGNSTVEVFDGVVSLGTTTANNGGAWNLSAAGPFAEGPHSITVKAKDAAGNTSIASAALIVNIDTTKPTVTIEQALGQADPTGASPINFTVVFSESPAGTFVTGDVSFAGSTAGGTLVGAVSGGPTTFGVAVTGMTTAGTVIASVAAGVATDAAGNTNFASTSVDHTVTFASTTTTSVVSSLNPSVYGDPVSFTATVTTSGGGTPTGSVQFKINGGNFGLPVPLSGGSASSGSISTLSVATHTVTADYTSDASLAPSTGTLAGGQVVNKATPVITWANPADITYPTALSGTQLNASADVSGDFVYTPADGAVLNAGNGQTLHVDFTPDDTDNYNGASKDVTINVLKGTPVITWANPADITYPTALSGTQLNASADVSGDFVYTPADGAVLNAGNGQTLHVDFTPDDTDNYNGASKDVTINVLKGTPVITWANPADITYPTALSGTQLNASADVSGDFVYTPADGAVLNAGNGQTLHVDFTPDDTDNYNGASKDVTINVLKGTPVITWANPADITYPTALSGTQLNASADVPGDFVYTPAEGAVLNAGNGQTLHVDFTPDDTDNYNGASKNVTINVLKGTPVITWANPADITYPTALSGTQLNASADVSGDFVYTPADGAVLNAGNGQTLHVDFTPDDTDNYNLASKNVTINVLKANAVCTVTGYDVPWDGATHTATGSCKGVFGETLSGLVLTGTIHTDVGTYNDTWTFTDVTGNYNDTSGTVTDKIRNWTAQGFYQPIGVQNSLFVPFGGSAPTGPTGGMAWNTSKGGSTIPLKFNVFAGGVEKTSVSDILYFNASRMASCGVTSFDDPVELQSTGGTTLRYDGAPGSGQFIQNWKTPSVKNDECYRVELTFADKSVLYTFVKLRK